MKKLSIARRRFLKSAGIAAGAFLVPDLSSLAETTEVLHSHRLQSSDSAEHSQAAGTHAKADYTLRIRTVPIEIAPDKIITLTTYNDQFPGPAASLQGRPAGHGGRYQRH